MKRQTAIQDLRVMQIGKFYHPYPGGIETHLQLLCESLRDKVRLSVLVANQGRQTKQDLVQGVEVTRLSTLVNFAAAPICPGMIGAIQQAKADLVHVHLPNPVAVMAYLASRHRGQLVVSYHSDVIRQKLLNSAFMPILHALLRRCDAIVVATPFHIDSSPVLTAYRNKCSVIPYGIQIEPFQQLDKAVVDNIRERYGPRLVMTVGRMVYYKGFEYLIRAMSKIDGRLLMVGDGPLRAKLEKDAWSSGVRDRIVFLGKLTNEEMIQHYQAADVFVLPSIARSEAFGIVQLEAMACGKPVVNTKLDSGVPFVSLDRQTGLTVPPADTDSLADAINLLLNNTTLRGSYGMAALRRVRDEFTLEVMMRRILGLYTQVVAELQRVNCLSQSEESEQVSQPA